MSPPLAEDQEYFYKEGVYFPGSELGFSTPLADFLTPLVVTPRRGGAPAPECVPP